MALSPGSRLGPYETRSPLGAGSIMRRSSGPMIALLVTVILCRAWLIEAQRPLADLQAESSGPQRIERLVALCKLWAAIKYFHPWLAYRSIDWDRAVAAAIPRVRAAANGAEYAAAIRSMLDALGDPATRVVASRGDIGRESEKREEQSQRERDPRFRTNSDGILIISISRYADLMDFAAAHQKLAALGKEIGNAKGVLFDIRASVAAQDETHGLLDSFVSDPALLGKLTAAPVTTPGQRFRMHSGFPPQTGSSSDYFSAFYTKDGSQIGPAEGARAQPVVFLINQNSELPLGALALQTNGTAAIVSDGPAPNDELIVDRQARQLPDGVRVEIRLSELVYADGSSGVRIDRVIPAGGSGSEDGALQAALAVVKKLPPASARSVPTLPARAAPPPDDPYPQMTYPLPEYRLLAAFRIWAVMTYFYPYRDLMAEDWDDVLREFIPKFEAASDEMSYALTVAEMGARIHDSHVWFRSPVLQRFFGVAIPPISLRVIEGVPIVTSVLDERVTKSAGVAIGDAVVKVDGVRIEDRMALLARYTPASTPQRLAYWVANFSLGGADNSTAKLVIRDAASREREIRLPRHRTYFELDTPERSGAVVKLLPGGIGYADLDRLTVPEVDAMFEKFRDARAIIFDVRGYPKGTAWEIAPRLTDKVDVVASSVQRPVIMAPEGPLGELKSQATMLTMEQRLPRSDKWKYKGRTVMLIDERTQSHAEHSGLFLEAANGTKFIGSPSSGTNGDVTIFFVPGGIRISFTGQSIRHADGRQLQRVGLVPDVNVSPTIKGIRSGRDEVLEAAADYLNHELEKSGVPK